MAGMSLFTDGEHVMVAKEVRDGALRNHALALAGLVAAAGVLGWAGAFDGQWWPWMVVAAAVGVAAAMPFATLATEVRFDREARLITVITTSPRRTFRREIPFGKVVELKAHHYASDSGADGYRVETQLETWELIRLNSQVVDEALALRWVETLHQFLGGRPSGGSDGRLEAFALPR